MYVAVVCDTDGSAFITKAEFDSLKNNFQAQIDNYNQSIDSKIDGAIASYLSGIKVNMDDTPKYRLFGAIENEDGKMWSTARLIELGDGYTWAGKEASTASARTWWIDKDYSDRGYGPAVWMYTLKDVDGAWPVLDTTFGYVQTTTEIITDSSTYPRIYCYYGGVPGEASSTATKTLNYGVTNINLRDAAKRPQMCSLGTSDAYQQRVSIWCPSFVLYEFLDNGEATFNFKVYGDGYEKDGGLKFKGRDCDDPNNPAKAGGHVFVSNTGSKLYFERVDGSEEVLLKGNNYTNGNTVTFTKNVKAGDKLKIFCDSSFGHGFSLEYSVIRLSANIPGWEIETT